MSDFRVYIQLSMSETGSSVFFKQQLIVVHYCTVLITPALQFVGQLCLLLDLSTACSEHVNRWRRAEANTGKLHSTQKLRTIIRMILVGFEYIPQ
jgi:hypothetical protein